MKKMAARAMNKSYLINLKIDLLYYIWIDADSTG